MQQIQEIDGRIHAIMYTVMKNDQGYKWMINKAKYTSVQKWTVRSK